MSGSFLHVQAKFRCNGLERTSPIFQNLKMSLLLLALTVAFIPSTCQARIFTGDTGDTQLPFLAAYAFGPNGGDLQISFNSDYTTSLMIFYDADWAKVYDAFTAGTLGCNAAQSAASVIVPLYEQQGTVVKTVNSRSDAFYAYVLAANLPACAPDVHMSYTLTATQSDGSELSWDERGLPALYGVVWSVLMLLAAAHVGRHYFLAPRFAPTAVLVYSAALGTFQLSCLLALVQWTVLDSDGTFPAAVVIASLALRCASHLLLIGLGVLLANGYGIVTYSLRTMRNLFALAIWGLFAVAYVAASIFRVINLDATQPNPDVSDWPAIVLIVLFCAFLLWLALALRRTIVNETRTDKRAVLFWAGAALCAFCMILPVVEVAGGLSSAVNRTRVRAIVDGSLHVLVFLWLAWTVWPSRARSAFRVSDGSTALLLQVDDAVLHLFRSEDGDALGDGGLGGEMGLLYQQLKLQDHGAALLAPGGFAPPSPPLGPVGATIAALGLPGALEGSGGGALSLPAAGDAAASRASARSLHPLFPVAGAVNPFGDAPTAPEAAADASLGSPAGAQAQAVSVLSPTSTSATSAVSSGAASSSSSTRSKSKPIPVSGGTTMYSMRDGGVAQLRPLSTGPIGASAAAATAALSPDQAASAALVAGAAAGGGADAALLLPPATSESLAMRGDLGFYGSMR